MTQAPQTQGEDSGLDSVLEKVIHEMGLKHWARSLTIWVNFIATLLLVAEANLHVLQPLLPLNIYAVAAFALPIINQALRFKTKQGITL